MTKLKQFKNKLKKKYLWRKYHDMAHYFCKGKGLEIGALPGGVGVRGANQDP